MAESSALREPLDADQTAIAIVGPDVHSLLIGVFEHGGRDHHPLGDSVP